MFSVAMLVDVSPILTPCVKKEQPDLVPGLQDWRNPERSPGVKEPNFVWSLVSKVAPHLSTALGRVGERSREVGDGRTRSLCLPGLDSGGVEPLEMQTEASTSQQTRVSSQGKTHEGHGRSDCG